MTATATLPTAPAGRAASRPARAARQDAGLAVEAICDDVVMVARGRLLFGGSVGALLDAQQATVRARPEHAIDTERLAAIVRSSGREAGVLPDGELEVQAPAAWTPELNRLATSLLHDAESRSGDGRSPAPIEPFPTP